MLIWILNLNGIIELDTDMKIKKSPILLSIIALLVLSSCAKKQMFHRADAENRETKDINLNLLKKDRDNNLYYHKKFVTFRFETKNDSVNIQSRLTGNLNVNMSCISDKKGTLSISKKGMKKAPQSVPYQKKA